MHLNRNCLCKQVTTSTEKNLQHVILANVTQLQQTINRLHRQLRACYKQQTILKKSLNKIFTSDQIRAMERTKNKGRQWSEETIKRSLQIKFSCGSRGYKTLLN